MVCVHTLDEVHTYTMPVVQALFWTDGKTVFSALKFKAFFRKKIMLKWIFNCKNLVDLILLTHRTENEFFTVYEIVDPQIL